MTIGVFEIRSSTTSHSLKTFARGNSKRGTHSARAKSQSNSSNSERPLPTFPARYRSRETRKAPYYLIICYLTRLLGVQLEIQSQEIARELCRKAARTRSPFSQRSRSARAQRFRNVLIAFSLFFLAHAVVESIMRGEVVGMTPRRSRSSTALAHALVVVSEIQFSSIIKYVPHSLR